MERLLLLMAAVLLAGTGCAKSEASIASSTSDALASSRLNSLAILPVPALEGASASELSLAVGRQISAESNDIRLVGPSDSRSRIEQNELTADWRALTETLSMESAPSAEIVAGLGRSLNVDAILQGVVYDIDNRQHAAFGNRGKIELTVRVVLLQTTTGEILWEARSRAVKEAETTFANPSMDEALELAINEILESFPTLE